MESESRFTRAARVQMITFYVLVIGKDVKRLAEAKFTNRDHKTTRKSLQTLVKDLKELEPNLVEVVTSLDGNSNMIEYHHALVTSAETHLKAFDDVGTAQTDREDAWYPLCLAMRGWCERMKGIDLQVNSKGGDATQALDLLWRNSANADNPASSAAPAKLLSDRYISLRLREIEERPLLRRPRILLGAYIIELGMMYETGAILGAARPHCAESLVKLCVGSLDDDNRYMLLGQAEFHMSKIRQSQGTAPNKYIDLVMDLFYANVAPQSRLEFIVKNAKTEKRREDAIGEMRVLFPWAIAFGGAFPEETKGLWEQAHEGVVFDFRQWQENILEIAAAFLAENCPEQIDGLGLNAQWQRLQEGKSVADEWLPKQ